MDNPELYANTNGLTCKEVREFLEEYIHLIGWKQDAGGSAMDVGCGPGNITKQILLPMLPESLRELVATDLSPHMIKYARSHNQHSRIRQAMQNIFDMVQPGGDVLLLYLHRHPCFDVILKLASLEHWKPYMKEPWKYVGVHHYVENVEESLYNLLQEVGFVDITCKCRRKEYVYENINAFTEAVIGVDPYISKLPAQLQEKYRQDLFSEHRIQAFTEGYTSSETDNLYLPYTLIIIHTRKP